MPFTSTKSFHYTRSEIEAISPNQIGVYGIYNASQWIYVGKGDIRDRMLAHFNGDNICINRNAPTGWVGELTHGDPSNRERELILELNPCCNKRVG
jgi:hypothetical protein